MFLWLKIEKKKSNIIRYLTGMCVFKEFTGILFDTGDCFSSVFKILCYNFF